MKKRAMKKISELAALRAMKVAADLKRQDEVGVRIRSMLSDLDQATHTGSDTDGNIGVNEARAHSNWLAWRLGELRRLQAELARHEVRIAPLKQLSARATAQEQVIREIVKRQSSKGRGGR